MNLRMIGLTAVAAFACLIPIVASADPGGSPAPVLTDEKSPDSSSEMHGEKLSDDPSVSKMSREDAARCGPELVSPEGIEAQTCVMTGGGETWARAYHRNTSGTELRAVLTLMGPGRRTTELHCVLAADDEPGSCETPRSASAGAPGAYAAVAEYAGAGPVEEAPLLLRAGSHRAPGASD
ncbi:hypothetical protein OG849_17760 [Streptomyces cyaneofuscatus]|uniref:DUF3558 domain-containing protein n=2 Tax=Streptomyces cyaneofuscatus TaxID=66883 RepID=A0ABZ1EXT0_9ACTN|nr:hypothetical protein OG849_17760 [Streptomyces cyaneofuscatus]WSD47502.1 hypothetical protein OG857_17645 [Streptomyces cyaneofuscatus]